MAPLAWPLAQPPHQRRLRSSGRPKLARLPQLSSHIWPRLATTMAAPPLAFAQARHHRRLLSPGWPYSADLMPQSSQSFAFR